MILDERFMMVDGKTVAQLSDDLTEVMNELRQLKLVVSDLQKKASRLGALDAEKLQLLVQSLDKNVGN